MKLLRMLCLGAVGLGLGCGGNDSTGTSGPGANEVWMQNTAFNRATRSVATGTTITFTNKDGVPHTVTSSAVPVGASMFDSGIVAGGGTYQETFTIAGTYEYYCQIHGSPGAGMHGTITVN